MAGRRKNGEGSIYPIKDKSGKITRYGVAVPTKEKRHIFTATTEIQAKKKAMDWLIANGYIVNKAPELTVNPYSLVEEVIQEYEVNVLLQSNRRTERSYLNNTYALNRFLNSFSGREISGITLKEIQNFAKLISQKYSPYTVRFTFEQIEKMYDRLFKKGVTTFSLAGNPDYERPVSKKQEEVIIGLDTFDLVGLIEAIKPNIRIYAPLWLMINTGMRSQEVLGLFWENINFNDNTIQITNAITLLPQIGPDGQKSSISKTVRTTTKTKKRNIVAVSQDVINTLYAWKEYAAKNTKTKFGQQDYVFGNTKYPSWSKSGFSKYINTYLNQQNVDHLRLHRLRHTAATLMILDGADVEDVKRQLGHSKLETTRRYIDQSKEIAKRNSLRLENQLKGLSKIIAP